MSYMISLPAAGQLQRKLTKSRLVNSIRLSGCGQTAAQLRGHDKDYTERLAHLKARLFEQSRPSWRWGTISAKA